MNYMNNINVMNANIICNLPVCWNFANIILRAEEPCASDKLIIMTPSDQTLPEHDREKYLTAEFGGFISEEL